MSALKIRKLEEKDLPRLLELIRELAEYEHGLNEVTVTVEELRQDGFGENPLYWGIVAEQDRVILGAAVYFYSYSTWNGKCLYLEDLIVSREFRVKGVGGALMKELIRIAKREKVKRMSWQVLDWNVDAQDFYRKFGAELDGEWLNGRFNERQLKAFDL